MSDQVVIVVVVVVAIYLVFLSCQKIGGRDGVFTWDRWAAFYIFAPSVIVVGASNEGL
jgi:hypothetical protein